MLVVFMMTGCMKFNMNMTINKDKSMDLAFTVALANSMMEGTNGADSSQLQKMKDNGYKVEEYSDNSMSGYNISTKIDNNIHCANRFRTSHLTLLSITRFI